MLLVKKGFPEEDELIMCTITKVQFHSVFCTLDEYGKSGMIHISEVSPGRIRNIRDFVREGKKVVCKVLRVNEEKGHIDLSLRRVTESQRRAKVDEIKQEQKAEKIIEFVAKSNNLELSKFFNEISEKILKNHLSISAFFQEAVSNPKMIEELGLDKKLVKSLDEVVKQRVKEVIVEIEGKLKLTSYEPNGIEIIKEALQKAQESGKGNIALRYLGGGNYHVQVKAKDYKEAEQILKDSTEAAIKFVIKRQGEGSFARAEA
ncbi:translation initiation factor IF-2 subunit alpha [Candidatus Woesearchaeota archaeon]|nr:translation initiation factor IF-2 subunit alpha [Candidatus Woesearchaeota archaeon]